MCVWCSGECVVCYLWFVSVCVRVCLGVCVCVLVYVFACVRV